MAISTSDQEFINKLLGEELEYELLAQLDKKLLDPEFKAAYEEAVNRKFSSKEGVIWSYLPMLVLLLLVVLGIILILVKI